MLYITTNFTCVVYNHNSESKIQRDHNVCGRRRFPLPVSPSVSLSTSLAVFLHVFISVFLFTFLCVSLSVSLYLYLSVLFSAPISVSLTISLSVSLSLSLWVSSLFFSDFIPYPFSFLSKTDSTHFLLIIIIFGWLPVKEETRSSYMEDVNVKMTNE